DGLAALLRVRDQGLCRTPFCDAPVRHLDHVVPAAQGGETTAHNGQGLCEACNLAKGALRQTTQESVEGRHTVVTVTSTSHRYTSTAPAPPRPATSPPQHRGRAPARSRPPARSPVERHLETKVAALERAA